MIKQLATLSLAAVIALAVAERPTLETAPTFSLPAASGKTISLSDYKGKYVVLEWWNHGCPFVKRHYNTGNMQKVQSKLMDQGVVWLLINSSATGQQGHVNAEEAKSVLAELKSKPTDVLLDHDGKVGKMYDAKTTPQMFLISPDGKVLYDGAIDDRPNATAAETAAAKNYLIQAFEEAKAGKPVSEPKTRPYGCSVKYPRS